MSDKTAEKSVAQTVRETVKNRLKEVRSLLAPLIAEERDLAEMAPGESPQFGKHEAKPAPVKPTKGEPTVETPEAPRQRRSRKGGTRAEQAVAFIAEHPGAKASEVAKSLKIKPNYLYRVLADLEKSGQVEKDGTKYKVPSA